MQTTAIIVAAGKGARLGAGKNKLLIEACGKTILEHTTQKFEDCSFIDDIIIVCSEEDKAVIEKISKNFIKVKNIVIGSDTRTKSVFNGLSALKNYQGIVLIHDGARPFVSEQIIKNCINGVKKHGSAITAVQVSDTIKRADANLFVTETLDRSTLYNIQTPQGFMFCDILSAYNKINESDVFTDDSAVYEKYFGKAYLTMGEPSNIKVTFNSDLRYFFKE